MAKTPPRQREKYAPKPKPTDECQCTRATAAKPFGEVTHQFPYQTKDGIRLFSRFRYRVTDPNSTEGDKTFRYCPHYDRTNAEHVSMPYGLPRIKEAIQQSQGRPSHTIYLVEGEPDCEATWALADAYATTTHLGTRFPLEVAEHFRGYEGKVLIVVDRDHLDPEHKARFEHEDPAKAKDYPGSASALRRARALRAVGVKSFFREAVKGKDMRDHLEAGKDLEGLRKIRLDEHIKPRAPKEAGNKRSTTLQLSQADMPEGPGMLAFITALEAKGYFLEKIGPTRYKVNCPHPAHDDHNPSFEFEQGAKGVVATCESYDCTVGDGMKEICEALGIRVKDLFDEQRGRPKKEQPPKPDNGDVYCPDAGDPMEVARYIQSEWVNDNDQTVGLMYANDDTWVHNGTHWEIVLDGAIRSRLYHRMDNECTLKLIENEWKPVRWAPAPAKIGALLESVRAINVKGKLPEVNTWQGPPEFDTRHVAMANGIFDIEKREMREHTPRYFNTWSLPFEYDPAAQCPGWIGFLENVFENDPESIRTLRQFMGYFISGRYDMEKILALIGPSRSGKGTIADMIEALMGPSSVESFTLKHLAGEFGLQNLVGKSVMIAADSRAALKAEDMQSAIERLLSLSANDKMIINRKNKLPISVRLGVRPVIMSNELPAFMDSSNAINQRMVMLKMRKSFIGREDHTLKARLMKEVQGVFNWALGGLDDLNETGKLLQPSSAQNYIDTLDEGASPHEQFISTFCEVGQAGDDADEFWCYHPELVQMWKSYCEANEMKAGNPNWLPRKLAPIITRLGGEMGKGWHNDEKGNSFRTITGIRLKQSGDGPKLKTDGANTLHIGG